MFCSGEYEASFRFSVVAGGRSWMAWSDSVTSVNKGADDKSQENSELRFEDVTSFNIRRGNCSQIGQLANIN
jgi:hypothetical protein